MENKIQLQPTTKKDFYEEVTLDFFNDMFNDSIYNYLDEKLKVKNLQYDEFKCEYDLSYSQGSHFEFTYLSSDILNSILKEVFTNSKKYTIELSQFKKNNWNYKRHWFEVELYKNGSCVEDEDVEIEIRDLVIDRIQDLERELFNIGRDEVEYQEKEEQFRSAFREFKEINSIESDLEYFELNYTEKQEEGFTKVWEGQYEELWVQLPEITQKSREEIYYEFS